MGDAPSPSVLYFDPKKSTENFARLCQFLVTICSDIMRDVLSHYIKPANLRLELDKYRSKLENITNAQEKDLLYPSQSSTSVPKLKSRHLDLSLLYKILRNICNIPTHAAGWGKQPVQWDFSLAACIERIRILRNSISGHSTNGTVDDVVFEDYWRELRTSVVEIEGVIIGSDKYEKGVDYLYDCDLNPTKSKEYVAQIRRNTGDIIIKRERIDLLEGEIIAKRERIDLVEEEVNAKRAKMENLERSQANLEKINASLTVKLEEDLTAVKFDILKELKATELRLQQKIGLAYTNKETITNTSTYKTIKSRITTTIKFKSAVSRESNVFDFSMHSTTENKCWVMVPCRQYAHAMAPYSDKAVSSKLYLLSDIEVIDEIEIPKEYDTRLFLTNITENVSGEMVFISGGSVVAAKDNGTLYKLFDLPKFDHRPFKSHLCSTPSGNYIIKIGVPNIDSFTVYDSKGVPLRAMVNHGRFFPDFNVLSRNTNSDIVFTHRASPFSDQFLVILDDKSFNIKHEAEIESEGIITTVMNNNSDLLYGHGQTIDLLNDRGTFVKTVYKTHRHDKIRNFAYSNNDTVWIVYDSFEIDILKLKIPQ